MTSTTKNGKQKQRNRKEGENANGLAKSPPKAPRLPKAPRHLRVEDLKDKSDDQLKSIVNRYHSQCCGTLMKATRDHARIVGAALILLKHRGKEESKKFSWGKWLKDKNNFAGSRA